MEYQTQIDLELGKKADIIKLQRKQCERRNLLTFEGQLFIILHKFQRKRLV